MTRRDALRLLRVALAAAFVAALVAAAAYPVQAVAVATVAALGFEGARLWRELDR